MNITVCIPTYKRNDTVRRCVQSVVSQVGYEKYVKEIRIYDNAPDQPAEKYLTQFRADKKITYKLNVINLGFEKNILNLLRDAKGEFILILTDDDTLVPGALELLSTLVEKFKPDYIASSRNIIHNNKFTRVEGLFSKMRLVASQDYKMQAKLFTDSFILTGIFVRRSAIDLKIYEKFIGSLCPHMAVMGKAIVTGRSFFNSLPITNHVVANKVYWENLPDYMIEARLRMAQYISPAPKFYSEVKMRTIRDIPYLMYINRGNQERIQKLSHALRKSKLITGSEIVAYSFYGVANLLFSKMKDRLYLSP